MLRPISPIYGWSAHPGSNLAKRVECTEGWRGLSNVRHRELGATTDMHEFLITFVELSTIMIAKIIATFRHSVLCNVSIILSQALPGMSSQHCSMRQLQHRLCSRPSLRERNHLYAYHMHSEYPPMPPDAADLGSCNCYQLM
jgi:hypothetical protein